jgi:hypothetical protein
VYELPGTAEDSVYRPVPSAPSLSMLRFFIPSPQTISAWPTSVTRNASGTFDVTVTTPVLSLPVATAPGGAQVPRRLLAFFGLAMKLMLAATVLAVSGLPSEQVTPGLSVYDAEVLLPDHLDARFDSTLPEGVKLISES